MKALLPLLCALGLAIAEPAGAYDFHVIDFPGAADTNVFAINDLGHFVGIEQDGSNAQHAIVFDGRTLHLLDPTGLVGTAAQSWAYSINNWGAIAGAYLAADGSAHGFVRHPDGSVKTIDYPGGINTQAFGINDWGTVIGVFQDAAGSGHSFILREGHYQLADLPGGLATVPLSINDSGEIAGEFVTTPGTFGFGYVEQNNKSFTLASDPASPPQETFFISINNRNQILGAYVDANGVQQNFLKTGPSYVAFNVPAAFGATFVSAQTINDFGVIVGNFGDGNQVQHGFVAIPSERHD